MKRVIDESVKDIIADIEAGNVVDGLDDYDKNIVNAILADRFSIGDTVQVNKTGRIGIVTKKIIYYDRPKSWLPYGYTAIEVKVGGRRNRYSARSLRKWR